MESFLLIGGVLVGLVGAWNDVILPNINSLPASVQTKAIQLGINPDNAAISPGPFSDAFFWYVSGGLIGTGLAMKYGGKYASYLSIGIVAVVVYLLFMDNQTYSGESQSGLSNDPGLDED